jgi:hypothetical protein
MKLENQSCVALLDKGVTIISVSRLDLISYLHSETASSSGTGINKPYYKKRAGKKPAQKIVALGRGKQLLFWRNFFTLHLLVGAK